MAEVKWSGVLSTTEPRNDVGIIKVRQGNVNSEVAEFQIVQNNKPYNLTGLTVYFCASFGLNLVEKPAVIVNAAGGRIQYTFDDDSMQSLGRQKGYFSIKKEESKIDSTQDFEYQVESSLMTRSIDGKSYIYKLSSLIKILDDFVKNGQKNFNTWFESVKEILYGVDPGGNILRELIEARKNSSGNIFTSLKERLDKNEDETNRQLAYTQQRNGINVLDFIEYIPSYNMYNSIEDIPDWYEAIEAAMDYMLANKHRVLVFPDAKLKTSGNHSLKSGMSVIGQGIGSQLVSSDGSLNSIFVTDEAETYENIMIANMQFDHNYFGAGDTAIQKSYHTLFLWNVKHLSLINVSVKNPVAWCTNINRCDDIMVMNFRAFSTKAQQDGLHFVDCSNVNVNGVYGKTGDDVLGITVEYRDFISDYTVSNVQGTSLIGSLVRLNQANSSVAKGEKRVMRDMTFTNLIGKNCGNRGFSVADVHHSSEVLNITVSGIFDNCGREGIRFVKGKRIKIKASVSASGKKESTDSVLFNRLDDSEVDVTIFDVADGFNGVKLEYGNHNTIIPNIDYITEGKSNIQFGVRLGNANYNKVRDGNIVGALRGVQVGSSTELAQRNKVYNNNFKDINGYAISEGTESDYNEFYGNHLVNTSGISKVGPNSVLKDNMGFRNESSGTAIIPAGSLSVTVAHSLYAIPKIVSVTPRTKGLPYGQSRTGSNLTFSIDSAQQVDVYFDWIARVE